MMNSVRLIFIAATIAIISVNANDDENLSM